MDVFENPFYILTASPRNNRRQLMELADERSLMLDTNKCMEARTDLTNPMKRLSAEVAWFPGLSPKNVQTVLTSLSTPIHGLPTSNVLIKLRPIVRANILAYGLVRLQNYDKKVITNWILELAKSFDEIDPEELRLLINEERIAAGFPEVTELSNIKTEIEERRRFYRKVIKSTLENLSTKEQVEVITVAVDSATHGGEEHGFILVADLVDAYEVEVQKFLEKEESIIIALVDKIGAAVEAKAPDSVVAPLVYEIIKVVKNWDTIAQPIQVSAKSRGLDHDASHRIAGMVRNLAIHMFNEHGKLDFTRQLTEMLYEVFAEVVEVAERVAKDADDLEKIAEERDRLISDAKNRDEEWRREITFEADIGFIFKNKLRISPDGIAWRGRNWELDSITRVRWGGTRRSVNGIPTGITYSIMFGNGSDYSQIELRREIIFSNFIERLWKSVCVRILMEYLEGLREGKKYRFGTAIMSDHGIELERKKFFSRNERVFCQWSDLIFWNDAGVFCIGKKDDKKVWNAFSYLDEDNIHIVEALIRMFWKRGGDRLSSLLVD